MRSLLPLVALVCGLILTGQCTAESKEKAAEIKGVTGRFVRVEFKADGAASQKIAVKAGTKIEIEVTYPIVAPLPVGVGGSTQDPTIVKYVETLSVDVEPPVVGVGRFGAFFVAEKKGKATLNFTLRYAPRAGKIFEVKVEVD